MKKAKNSNSNRLGRPTKYIQQFNEIAAALAESGMSQNEIAEKLGIHRSTLYRWINRKNDFCDSIKNGNELSDEAVEVSLFKRACGYEIGKRHIPPEVTACIFWLKNRRPDRWRDIKATELTGRDGGPVEIKHDLSQVSDEEIRRLIAAAERIVADEAENDC